MFKSDKKQKQVFSALNTLKKARVLQFWHSIVSFSQTKLKKEFLNLDPGYKALHHQVASSNLKSSKFLHDKLVELLFKSVEESPTLKYKTILVWQATKHSDNKFNH